jgi:hypothetical protein
MTLTYICKRATTTAAHYVLVHEEAAKGIDIPLSKRECFLMFFPFSTQSHAYSQIQRIIMFV